jgi:hypothetical protein
MYLLYMFPLYVSMCLLLFMGIVLTNRRFWTLILRVDNVLLGSNVVWTCRLMAMGERAVSIFKAEIFYLGMLV